MSKILKAFSAINLDENGAGEAIQSAFDEMYIDILQKHQKELSKMLESFMDSFAKVFSTEFQELYKNLNMTELLKDVSDREDDFDSLKSEFNDIYKKTNLRKRGYLAEADAFPETNHWFCRHISVIADKIDVSKKNSKNKEDLKKKEKAKPKPEKKFTISNEIITMLYHHDKKTDDSENDNIYDPVNESLFQLFISVFKKNIPSYWKTLVYVYFLGEYASNYLGNIKQFQRFSFDTKPSAKNFYEKVVTLIITEYIAFRFNGETPDWEAYLWKNNLSFIFNQLKNYYVEKGLFKSEFINMLKGRQFCGYYTQRLLQVHIASVMCFCKKLNEKERGRFFKEIGSDSISKWSISDCFLNEPNEEEIHLKKKIERAICLEGDGLKLFIKTGEAAENDFPGMKVRVDKDKRRLSDCCGKQARTQVIKSLLCDLIIQYDTLNINIPRCSFPEYKKDDFTNYVIHCLKLVEKKLLEEMKNDNFYADAIKTKQYDSIREILKHKMFLMDTNVSSIYSDVLHDIEQAYLKDRSLTTQITVQDLLSEINLYFFNSFQNPLDEKSAVLSHKDFFKSCEFFGNVKDDKRFLSCAAHGFLSECENQSAQEIVNRLLKLIPTEKKEHLEFCSEHFLNFACVVVLGLPVIKKREVIENLVKYVEAHASAEDRAKQKMMILVLNLILIQTDFYLAAETVRKLMDSIYRLTFYPEQMGCVEKVMDNPFCKSIIDEHIFSIQEPQPDENGMFPSPFYLYVVASEVASREQNSGCESCLKLKEKKKISLVMSDATVCADVDSFYRLCLLIEGVEWRISSRTDYQVDADVFRFLILKASAFWKEAAEMPTIDLLKLTWGSELLLTFFSDSFRKNSKSDMEPRYLDTLAEIALMSDLTQRMRNKNYRAFINSDESDGKDFWLISGAFRFACLEKIHTKKISFFSKNEEAAKFYCQCLRTEKHRGNVRFYVLLARLLSKTDFFDVIGSFAEANDLLLTRKNLIALGLTEKNYVEKFLEYDKIKSFLNPIFQEK